VPLCNSLRMVVLLTVCRETSAMDAINAKENRAESERPNDLLKSDRQLVFEIRFFLCNWRSFAVSHGMDSAERWAQV